MKFSFNLLFIILIFGCGNSPTLLNVAGEKKVVNDITALIQDLTVGGKETNAGDVTIYGNDLTFGNGATIGNDPSKFGHL